MVPVAYAFLTDHGCRVFCHPVLFFASSALSLKTVHRTVFTFGFQRLRASSSAHSPSTPAIGTCNKLRRPCGRLFLYGAGGGGRTRTSLRTRDFESRTSANSITPAQHAHYTTSVRINQDAVWLNYTAGRADRPACILYLFFIDQEYLAHYVLRLKILIEGRLGVLEIVGLMDHLGDDPEVALGEMLVGQAPLFARPRSGIAHP